MIAVIWGSLAPESSISDLPLVGGLGDKWLHAAGYLLLAFLAMLSFVAGGRAWIASCTMFLLGIALEFAQQFTFDRRFDGADIVANLAGSGLGEFSESAGAENETT
jgi:VanZ family protein